MPSPPDRGHSPRGRAARSRCLLAMAVLLYAASCADCSDAGIDVSSDSGAVVVGDAASDGGSGRADVWRADRPGLDTAVGVDSAAPDAAAVDGPARDSAPVDAVPLDVTVADTASVDAASADVVAADLTAADSTAPDRAPVDAGPLLDHIVIEERFGADLASFQTSGGAWSVAGGELSLDSPAAVEPIGNLALHGVVLFHDFDLRVRARAPDETGWDDCAVVVAYQGPDSYLYVALNEANDANTSGVFRWDGARTELLDIPTAFAPGVDHDILVQARGERLSVQVDGVEVAAVGGLGSLAGRVGLGTYNNRAAFDDLLVTVRPDDSTPPATPTGLQGIAVGLEARLSWQPASDDTAVVGYRVLRDGAPITGAPHLWTSFSDPGLEAGSSHSYAVVTVDGHGNTSAPSATVQVDISGQVEWDPGPHISFDTSPLGNYTSALIQADWPNIAWASPQDRAAIVEGAEAYSGRSLRIYYPEGSVGPGEGGAQWKMGLPQDYDELYCSFRVKFGAGFDFVRGGKIPGLLGGAGNTGGARPDGTDGWSARMMWRVGGEAVQYVYHPDQPGTYGEDFAWDIGGQRSFVPGTWHLVEHRVVMNTPTQHDGLIQGWWDGALALDQGGLRFRDVSSFAIDAFYFSTFFGGDDATWAATKDEHVYFDDFIFSVTPITH